MGYFDIQVNGYGGVDFNQDDLQLEDLLKACRLMREQNVDAMLPTIITEDVVKMRSRIARLAELRSQDPLLESMIAGIHIEGPFLNAEAGFKGAHPEEVMTDADEKVAGQLLEAGQGLVKLLTLAPERDPGGRVTRFLHEAGVKVSAGHTNASLDQLKESIDSGLSLFTHLGNGCPGTLPRHDNIVQRALFLRKDLCLCFIADGVHVPFFALRNYMDLALDGSGGGCLVTSDAMAAAGLGVGTYQLSRWTVEVKEDLAAWAQDGSHLVGSAMSMERAAKNLAESMGLDQGKIRLLTEDTPKKLFQA